MGKLRDAWSVIRGKASLAPAVEGSFGMFGQALSPSRDLNQLIKEGFKKNVVVFHCVDQLAKGVAHTPFVLKRKLGDGSLEDVTKHPVLELLKNPNPEQTWEELLYAFVAHYAIGGNSYMEAVGRGNFAADPVELWIKRPDRMRVVPGRAMVAAFEFRLGSGDPVRWPVDQVNGDTAILHLRTFAPLSEFYGMSPLESAALNVDQHNEGDIWNYNLVKKGATKPGVVTSDKILEQTQHQNLRARLNEQSGSRSVGEHMLLTGPNVKWQDMGISPKDLMQLENKEATARFICLAYNYPPFLLGLPSGATFNNVAEAKLHFWDSTQVPLIQKVVEKLNKWLLSKYGGSEELLFVPDFDQVPAMEPRRKETWERVMKGVSGGVVSANEAREEVGLDLREGEPLADALRFPSTSIPTNEALDEGGEGEGEGEDGDKSIYDELPETVARLKRGTPAK